MVLGKLGSQRGAGAIGCLFMAVVIAAGMYAGFQFGLPRLRHSSFEDRLTESITAFRQVPPEEAQKQIVEMAAEFDIELTPAQVKVAKLNGVLTVDLAYEKLVDLKFWQKTIQFRTSRRAIP